MSGGGEAGKGLWRQMSGGEVTPELEQEALRKIEGRFRQMRQQEEEPTVLDLQKGPDGVFRPLEERPSQEIPALALAFAKRLQQERPSFPEGDPTIDAGRAFARFAARDAHGIHDALQDAMGEGAAGWLSGVHQAALRYQGVTNTLSNVLDATNELLRRFEL